MSSSSHLSTAYVATEDEHLDSMPVLDAKIETMYMPMVFRTDALGVVRRIIDVVIVNFAIDYGQFLDRVNDIMLVFVIFLVLAFATSYVKYLFESWRRRLARFRVIYENKRRLLEERLERQHHKRQPTQSALDQELRSVYVRTQIESVPSALIIVEYFLDLAGYIAHLLELFIGFLLAQLILDAVEDNVSSAVGATRITRLLKPLIIIFVVYVQFSFYSSKNAFLS